MRGYHTNKTEEAAIQENSAAKNEFYSNSTDCMLRKDM